MRKTRVAIVGTNGIPANYGGFETLAHNLVDNLHDKVDFIVYCSKKQQTKRSNHKTAKLIYVPLDANGAQGLIYDTFTIIHAFLFYDVVLYLGPGIGILLWLKYIFRKKLITNHGGLNEWEREKLSSFQKKFAFVNHKYAARFSDINVVDNNVLQASILATFGVPSAVIRYGGDHVIPQKLNQRLKAKFPFLDQPYYLCVARAQVDNNIHLLINAFLYLPEKTLVVVSNWSVSDYGQKMKKNFAGKADNIFLIDAIYNQEELDAIRANAYIYIHSHAQCGTAPSLVEAISLNLAIISYDVPQNRETLQRDNYFFKSESDLTKLVNDLSDKEVLQLRKHSEFLAENFTWKVVANQYLKLLNVKK